MTEKKYYDDLEDLKEFNAICDIILAHNLEFMGENIMEAFEEYKDIPYDFFVELDDELAKLISNMILFNNIANNKKVNEKYTDYSHYCKSALYLKGGSNGGS